MMARKICKLISLCEMTYRIRQAGHTYKKGTLFLKGDQSKLIYFDILSTSNLMCCNPYKYNRLWIASNSVNVPIHLW